MQIKNFSIKYLKKKHINIIGNNIGRAEKKYIVIKIIVIFSDNPQYEQILPMFQEYGYGFMIPNKNLILINKKFVKLTHIKYNNHFFNIKIV